MDILDKIREARAGYGSINLLNRRVFLDNLAMSLQMMAASEKLIRIALWRLDLTESEFNKALHAYFVEHLQEETGHYDWMRADLEGEEVGFDWAGAELAGTQYYLVNHEHPATLLGYMAVLECFPVPLALVEELEIAHGQRVMRTVRYHAVHDQDHGKDVLRMIEMAPPKLQELIVENAIRTAHKIGAAQEKFGGKHG